VTDHLNDNEDVLFYYAERHGAKALSSGGGAPRAVMNAVPSPSGTDLQASAQRDAH
jgi:hypothetical protein